MGMWFVLKCSNRPDDPGHEVRLHSLTSSESLRPEPWGVAMHHSAHLTQVKQQLAHSSGISFASAWKDRSSPFALQHTSRHPHRKCKWPAGQRADHQPNALHATSIKLNLKNNNIRAHQLPYSDDLSHIWTIIVLQQLFHNVRHCHTWTSTENECSILYH